MKQQQTKIVTLMLNRPWTNQLEGQLNAVEAGILGESTGIGQGNDRETQTIASVSSRHGICEMSVQGGYQGL